MISVFISYDPADQDLKTDLDKQLKLLQRQGQITTYSDGDISQGWGVDNNLEKADIILLLVSANFLANDSLYDDQMVRAMDRHQNQLSLVVPVILSPCDWKTASFGKLTPLPRNGVPVQDRKWFSKDEAYTQIVTELKGAIQFMGKVKAANPDKFAKRDAEAELMAPPSNNSSSNTTVPKTHKTTNTVADGITKILFLASSPDDQSRLRQGREYQDIDDKLQRANFRDKFELESKWAVRPSVFNQALLDIRPNIVHFSGHGAGSAGLVFENDYGTTQAVPGEALAAMFGLFADSIQCVIMNACYSEQQALGIVKSIPYVIGMNDAIPDATAINFASSFYASLASGKDIEFSFNFAKTALLMEGLPGDQIPVLHKKG